MLMGSLSGEALKRLQIFCIYQWSGDSLHVHFQLLKQQQRPSFRVKYTSEQADKYGCRVRAAFKMAQRAIPLVADLDPVEVIYEDEDIIAVNKPTGVISAPKHRFTVSKALYQPSAAHVADICMGYHHCKLYLANICHKYDAW